MIALIVTLTVIVSYLGIGFLLSRLNLPYFMQSAAVRHGDYMSALDPYSIKSNRDRIEVSVRQDTYLMTFLWPVWEPVILAHRMSANVMRRYDPYNLEGLERLQERLQLRQIEAARKDDDD